MFTTSPIGSKHRVTGQTFSRHVDVPPGAFNLQGTRVNQLSDSNRQSPFVNYDHDNSISDESDIFIDDSEEQEDDILFSAEESARLNEDFHHLSFQQSETPDEQDDIPPRSSSTGPLNSILKSGKRVTFQDHQPVRFIHENASEDESFTFAQDFTSSITSKVDQFGRIFLKFSQKLFGFRTLLLISIPVVISLIYSNASQFSIPALSWSSKDALALFSDKLAFSSDPEKKLALILEKSESQLKHEAEELVKSLRSELDKRTQELNYDVSSLLHIIEQQRNLLEETSEKSIPNISPPVEVVIPHADIIDYAKTSAGAIVDKSLTSRCYMPNHWNLWGIWVFIRRVYGFRTFDCMPAKTILSDEPTESGIYWPLRGSSGRVTVELPLVLSVDSFGLSFPAHHKLENRGMAPKDIIVWGSVPNKSLKERITKSISQNADRSNVPADFVQLMDFRYDVTSAEVFQSKAFHSTIAQTPIKKIMIQILSNWGEPEATAVYRVEVLGKPFVDNSSSNTNLDSNTELFSENQALGSDEDLTF